MKQIKLLKDMLRSIENRYGIYVIIKDFFRIMGTKPDLAELLYNFYAHNNPYCVYIKSNMKAMSKCLSSEHTEIGRKINSNPSDYENGKFVTCCFGVRELYYPIRCSGYTIGALVFGCSSCSPEEYKIICGNISDEYGFEPGKVKEIYEKHLTPCVMPEEKEFLTEAAVCGEMLSMICDKVFEHSKIDLFFKNGFITSDANAFFIFDGRTERILSSNFSTENRTMTIILNTLQYIQKNYRNKITINDIAKYCYCSTSTLSHIFAKNYGMKISDLVNMLRCERAKNLLLESNLSVYQVATECGFSSADYLTSVFKKQVGVTPSEYRKSIKK